MNPYEAARVTRLMAKDLDQPKVSPSGEWQLDRYTVSEEEAQLQKMRASVEAAKRGGLGADRYVPAGDYVALRKRVRRDKRIAEKFGLPVEHWATMMSDTPNEIEDHGNPLKHGTGRVLVNGLGLGCIVHGLLAKPDVEHIDVVEIEREVIDLIVPYLPVEDHNPTAVTWTGDRLRVIHGDCNEIPWLPSVHWDYVWHDIWLRISADNLTDQQAEGGVSYQKLLRKFEDRCDRQEAWALDEAVLMEQQHKRQEAEAEALVQRWKTMTPRERTDFAVEKKVTVVGKPAAISAEDVREAAEKSEDFREFLRQAEEWVEAHPTINHIEALLLLGYASIEDALHGH